MPSRRTLLTTATSLAACAVPAVLLWWCFREVDFRQLLASVARMRWGLAAIAVVALSTVQWLMACEWSLLLPRARRVGFGRLLGVVSIVVMLQNSLHHFAGHAFAIYQLGHRQRVGKSVMLSVLSMDQLAEVTARLLVWGLLALFIGLPAWAAGGVWGVLGLACVLYVVLLVFAWRHRDFQVSANPGRLSGWDRLRYHFAEWAHHLHGIRHAPIIAAAVCLAMSKKLARAAGVYCVQQSFGIDLPLYAPLLVVATLELATMVSITPGHLGIFEASLFFIYQHLGLGPTEAMTLALVGHLVFLLGALLPGCIVSARWGFRLGSTDSPLPAETLSEEGEPSLKPHKVPLRRERLETRQP